MLKVMLAALFGLQMAFFVPTARAELLSTHEVLRSSPSISKKLLAELDKAEVRAELNQWGLDVEEAKQRLAGMSDAEIQEIVNGTQPHAGADVIVISLTTILLVVIIILLID